MAQFMLSTLQALLAGDILPDDACYTIYAHLASVRGPEGANAPDESEIQTHVKRVVNAVANGMQTAEDATKGLLALKDHFASGQTLSDFPILSS